MASRLVGTSAEFKEGLFTMIPFGKFPIGITRVRDQLYAVLDFCPHAGAPICTGRIDGVVTSTGPGASDYDHSRPVIRCPWHHWEFDLNDGRMVCPGTQKLKLYKVTEVEGQVWLEVAGS